MAVSESSVISPTVVPNFAATSAIAYSKSAKALIDVFAKLTTAWVALIAKYDTIIPEAVLATVPSPAIAILAVFELVPTPLMLLAILPSLVVALSTT